MKINKDLLQKVIDKYGTTLQTTVAMEELAELIKEISKVIRGNKNADGMIEEIADVLIMIEQLKLMYNISDEEIQSEINDKLYRMEWRLRKENESNSNNR